MTAAPGGLRVAVLVKQVPRFDELALGPDGRLRRDGAALELNPYCRRAVGRGVALARQSGGRCTALTLGPPPASDCLREAIAWGADTGVHLCDPLFAGSDTLATARALAAALELAGPFDLVLAGRNSVDADTGQVGPAVAELLGLPFLPAARSLDLDGRRLRAECELDDGSMTATVDLPAVVSCAERLCEPAKVDPDGRARVPATLIRIIEAAALGPGPWGQPGSPTRVGDVRRVHVDRRQLVLDGPLPDQVATAVAELVESGCLTDAHPAAQGRVPAARAADPPGGSRDDQRGDQRGRPEVAVLVEPGGRRAARELLGAAARLAAGRGGTVAAVLVADDDPAELGRWGADAVISLQRAGVAEDVSHALADHWSVRHPWAALAPSTAWGREVAARLSARLGAGLIGDAVDVDVDGDRLVGWKPAFGGSVVAAVSATSPLQMVTVRPGVLALLAPRPAGPVPVPVSTVQGRGRSRVRAGAPVRDDEVAALATAGAVVGVGRAVPPQDYPMLAPLLAVLGAELGATRKVTDSHWMARSRQIGITGRSLSPRLYVGLGLSGRFNHMVGVRAAGSVLAVNRDPAAPVFGFCDVGIVGDWRQAVPLLVEALASAMHGHADLTVRR